MSHIKKHKEIIEFEYIRKITFTIPGVAVTKSNQHGMTTKSGRPIMFVPKKYKDYEKLVREAAKVAMEQAGYEPFEGDCIFGGILYFDTRRLRDLQNLPKSICDALNKIVYKDDSRIRDILKFGKRYDKDNPRAEITVYETNKRWYEIPQEKL